MKSNKKLEWNVLVFDTNTRKIKKYNIFNNSFHEELKKKKVSNINELEEFVKHWCMYRYWSKTEWEVLMGGLFEERDKFNKIDVWTQIEINFDRIIEYIKKELEITYRRSK